MTGRPFAGLFLALLMVGSVHAEDTPKLPDVAAFDKLVVDALREVHNRGADLYNTAQNYEAAYRMYQGGLVAVRPLLGHRPGAQKLIDDGIAAADKESTPARRAFKLHETIEGVRKYLKDVNEPRIKPIEPEPKKKEPEPKKKEPVEVKKDPEPTPKKKDPEPMPKKEPEPKKKEPEPMPKKDTGLSGKVSVQGKVVAGGEVAFVSLDLAKPRVFTATTQADGSYKFTELLPPGRYAVIVNGKGVPDKFTTTTTSGLVITVKAGSSTQDIDLK
ncbi:MAG: carboxypeptidase-like regulatory domain-containing protein [Gemmataceae bacterium]